MYSIQSEKTIEDYVLDNSFQQDWVSIHLKVSSISTPAAAASWVSSPSKTKQAGILVDKNQTEVPFINWKKSKQPFMEVGEVYRLKKLFLVNRSLSAEDYDAMAIFRSDTSVEIKNGVRLTHKENCPSCETPLKRNNYKQGPEYPDIGWEYVECSNCESVFRPESTY